MPETKVRTTYLCNICSDEYESLAGALACEERGVAIAEFKRNEVVKLVGLSSISVASGFRVKGVKDGTKGVVFDVDRENELNPHLLPAYYEVWIQTPGGPYKREIAGLSREKLKKVTVRNGASCPLCASSTKSIYNNLYLTIDGGLPLVKNMPMFKCLNCNVEFFSAGQLKQVDLLIRKNTNYPLASTQRLIRERRFQY